MLPAESLCVIVLQTREEKSSVNNFDVPSSLEVYFDFDCGQTSSRL